MNSEATRGTPRRDVTVHLYDPEPRRRDRRAAILSDAGFDVRTYDNRESLLDGLSESRPPGCLVSDVHNPAMEGLALLLEIYENGLALPVVIIDGEVPVPVIARIMKAGAVDFLVRPVRARALVDAVDQAMEMAGQIGPADVLPVATAERLSNLTDKEREVLGGLMQGHTTRSIAETLGISPRTVEIHRGRVLVKMQASNVAHLVRILLSRGGAGKGFPDDNSPTDPPASANDWTNPADD